MREHLSLLSSLREKVVGGSPEIGETFLANLAGKRTGATGGIAAYQRTQEAKERYRVSTKEENCLYKCIRHELLISLTLKQTLTPETLSSFAGSCHPLVTFCAPSVPWEQHP